VVLAVDQGTTGSTCIVFDERMEPVGRAYREFAQHFPRPGWVEHDLGEIWEVTHAVAGEALDDAGVRAGELVAVGALPEVRASAGVLGVTRPEALHGHTAPVAGVAGDQQAALFSARPTSWARTCGPSATCATGGASGRASSRAWVMESGQCLLAGWHGALARARSDPGRLTTVPQ
jgi:glycerol kinase